MSAKSSWDTGPVPAPEKCEMSRVRVLPARRAGWSLSSRPLPSNAKPVDLRGSAPRSVICSVAGLANRRPSGAKWTAGVRPEPVSGRPEKERTGVSRTVVGAARAPAGTESLKVDPSDPVALTEPPPAPTVPVAARRESSVMRTAPENRRRLSTFSRAVSRRRPAFTTTALRPAPTFGTTR